MREVIAAQEERGVHRGVPRTIWPRVTPRAAFAGASGDVRLFVQICCLSHRGRLRFVSEPSGAFLCIRSFLKCAASPPPAPSSIASPRSLRGSAICGLPACSATTSTETPGAWTTTESYRSTNNTEVNTGEVTISGSTDMYVQVGVEVSLSSGSTPAQVTLVTTLAVRRT